MDEIELWAPIKGWEGYEISSFGRVKTFRMCGQIAPGGGQKVGIQAVGRIMNPVKDSWGYATVNLCRGVGCTPRRFQVHRLVLEAFVGPRPPGLQACHSNGIPDDNRLSNLRWDTPAANHADKRIHGTLCNGSMINTAKLVEADIPGIFTRRSEGMSHRQIGEIYGVSKQAVRAVLLRKTWTHVSPHGSRDDQGPQDPP